MKPTPFEKLAQLERYALCRTNGSGMLLRETWEELGPDVLAGMLANVGTLRRGHYAILCWTAGGGARPDWGVLVVRSATSWVLRHADGEQVICPDRLGAVVFFDRSES